MNSSEIQQLSEKIRELSNYITDLHFERNPAPLAQYGADVKTQYNEDATFHLNFLVEALTMNMPDMYASYMHWAAIMLRSRNAPDSDLLDYLYIIQQAVHELLGEKISIQTQEYIVIAKAKLNEKQQEYTSFITDENPLKKEASAYLDYLLAGKRREAAQLISDLIQHGVSIKEIYESIFQVTQYEVGRLWQCNKITMAHEHYCTAATQQIMSGLYRYIFSTVRKGKTLVASTISGDLHEIGIRMVSDFFEMDGWDTIYLGANTPDHQLQESLVEYKADVLALSVTLPTHVSKAASLIKKIRGNSKLENLKIMVGGYAFISNPELWQKVDADAFVQNANQAISRANELVEG